MTRTPSDSGIYVVTIDHVEPVSVSADRPDLKDQSAFVDCMNCKIGKADNLARREKEYQRTFGKGHVTFKVVVVSTEHHAIEAEVVRRLDAFRLPGRTGRPLEWLEGVEPAAVIQLIETVATQHSSSPPFATGPRQVSAPAPKRHIKPQRQSLSAPGSVSPGEIVAALRYLGSAGMTVDMLRDLHHSPARRETFSAAIQYFSRAREIRATNFVYGCRLNFVAQEHAKGHRSFSTLVHEAVARFPH